MGDDRARRCRRCFAEAITSAHRHGRRSCSTPPTPSGNSSRATATLAPGSPQEALAELLLGLFAPAELQSWAAHWFGQDFALLLPRRAPAREYVAVFIATAEQQGLLDEAFFRELRAIRLRFATQIDAVARAYLHP